MHPYTISVKDKVIVYWITVPISLIGGYFLNQWLKDVTVYQQYSWVVDAPVSGLALFGLLFKAFDLWIWKWLGRYGIIFQTPVLNGKYTGTLLSSRDGRTTPIPITMQIEQTLSKIRICLSTDQSTSKSEMANILIDEPGGPLIIFEYLNDHRKRSDPGLTIHRGITRLTFNKETKSLSGTYYTSPERGNFGDIDVTKD